MHEELKHVLTMYREKKKDKGTSGSEVLLDQYSTPREVLAWFTAKEFSEKYDETYPVNVQECREIFN